MGPPRVEPRKGGARKSGALKVVAEFGQTVASVCVLVVFPKTNFGQNRLWPKPTLTCGVQCVCVFVCGVGVGFTVSWFGVSREGVGLVVFGPPGPPFPWTAQNFALFFLPPSFWPLRGRRGFTRQPENSKRAHLSAPARQMWLPGAGPGKPCLLNQMGNSSRLWTPQERIAPLRANQLVRTATDASMLPP